MFCVMTHPSPSGRTLVAFEVGKKRRVGMLSAFEDVLDYGGRESQMPPLNARPVIKPYKPSGLLMSSAANGAGYLHRFGLRQARGRDRRPDGHDGEAHGWAAFCGGR